MPPATSDAPEKVLDTLNTSWSSSPIKAAVHCQQQLTLMSLQTRDNQRSWTPFMSCMSAYIFDCVWRPYENEWSVLNITKEHWPWHHVCFLIQDSSHTTSYWLLHFIRSYMYLITGTLCCIMHKAAVDGQRGPAVISKHHLDSLADETQNKQLLLLHGTFYCQFFLW